MPSKFFMEDSPSDYLFGIFPLHFRQMLQEFRFRVPQPI
jgi:hypothetical protein